MAWIVAIAVGSWILANVPSGPDIGFYARALIGFVAQPLEFYHSFPLYTYPPLQLYLSLLAYGVTKSAIDSLRIVSLLATLLSGLLVYIILGKGVKGMIGAALLMFNPYYAQYSVVNLTSEALITPFFLLSLYEFRRHDKASGALAGLAALSKQEFLYPAFFLALSLLKEGRRKYVIFVGSIVVVFVFLSSPFLLFEPLTYLQVITGRAVGYQSLIPGQQVGPAAFSSFWSFLTSLGSSTGLNTGALQGVRPLVWFALMMVVAAATARRDFRPAQITALGYLPFLLGSDLAGGWYLVVIIPALILVYLDFGLRPTVRYAALAMLLSLLLYRLADNYSSVTGRSPPYVIADLALGVTSLAFLVASLSRWDNRATA